GCVQGCARFAGGTFAGAEVYPAGYTMDDGAPGAVWNVPDPEGDLLAIATVGREARPQVLREFPNYFLWRFVVSQPEEDRMPQAAVFGPFRKTNLCHEMRF